MEYRITKVVTDQDMKESEICLTYKTENEGEVTLYAYDVAMDFDNFLEFARMVDEIRDKFCRAHQGAKAD